MFRQITEKFRIFANFTANLLGSAYAFIVAALLILTWASLGSVFNYSTTWQLIANTFTTLVTFLMGFLILNTANRNNSAQQAKLDEIIRCLDKANNSLIDIEDHPDNELKEIKEEIKKQVSTGEIT